MHVGASLCQVPEWQLISVLTEFRRVLVPGGVIRIAAYDLEAAIEAYERRDDAFFWDETGHRAERAGRQLVDWGAARSLLSGPLLVRALHDAGFADAAVQPFQLSGYDLVLAAADRFEAQCVRVEAVNGGAWPMPDLPRGPEGTHLSWADDRCASVDVTWLAPPGSSGSVRLNEGEAGRWATVPARCWSTVDGNDAPVIQRAHLTDVRPGGTYRYEVVVERADGEVRRSGPQSFRGCPSSRRSPSCWRSSPTPGSRVGRRPLGRHRGRHRCRPACGPPHRPGGW